MKYLSKIAMALVLVFGLAAMSAPQAEAGKKGKAIAGAIAGAVVLGILANELNKDEEYYDEERCYKGERVCKKKRVCWENQWGEERCKWKRKCYRPTYCD